MRPVDVLLPYLLLQPPPWTYSTRKQCRVSAESWEHNLVKEVHNLKEMTDLRPKFFQYNDSTARLFVFSGLTWLLVYRTEKYKKLKSEVEKQSKKCKYPDTQLFQVWFVSGFLNDLLNRCTFHSEFMLLLQWRNRKKLRWKEQTEVPRRK